MPLMDALQSGVNLVNSSNQGVGNAAAARYAFSDAQLKNEYQKLINQYYGPEHQASIDYQNITNQYLPEKLRLGNQYQGLVNENYTPNIQSEIRSRDAETQFVPLKYAIQAENAMRNNSRFGGSYQYLKSVADMPADVRTVWMGDPDNNAQYQAEIQNLHNSMSNNQSTGGQSSLITPALLKKVGLESLSQDIVGAPAPTGVVVGQDVRGGLAAPLPNAQNSPAMQGGQPPVVVNVPPQGSQMSPQSQPSMQLGGMAAPLPGMTQAGPSAMMPPQQGFTPMGAPPIATPQQPMAQPPRPMQPNVGATPSPSPKAVPENAPPLTPQAASIAQKDGISTQEANKVANDSKNPELSSADKQLLATQMLGNKKMVDAKTTARALAAITYEKVLAENQDRIAPAFENAAKYAGIIGSGKLTLDKFKNEHPKEYQDYMWVVNDLVPNLTNNVRMMEGLASTDSQRHALNDMYGSVLRWESDPKMAINNINKTMKLFGGQAKAALETAQPRFSGVLEKLYGLKMNKGEDYVGPNRGKKDYSQMSTDDLMKLYQGANNG